MKCLASTNGEIVMDYKASARNMCKTKVWRGIDADEDAEEALDGGVD